MGGTSRASTCELLPQRCVMKVGTSTRSGAYSFGRVRRGGRMAEVCSAISDRSLLSFTYGGRARIVEPYLHGYTSTDREVALCFQREGDSASGGGGWRLFHVDEMKALEVL